MAEHIRFYFKTLEELQNEIQRLNLDLPITDNLEILSTPVTFGRGTIPNRLGTHPMEGCDGLSNGAPSELTARRYRRFGAGGSGLIWFEACAITKESRANPRQLWIHDDVLPEFKQLVDMTREAAQKSMNHDPFLVLQLTHSGRYSRPVKKPAPIIAHHSKVLDPKHNLPPDYPLITDEELDRLQGIYLTAAEMAKDAGFDAVDIKSCHRYLISELLASFTRENSRYGGSFDNRVRMLLETVKNIRQEIPDFEVTSRLNVYDAIEFPYGWGVSRDDYRIPDLTEPLELIKQLQQNGYHGINITIANPYFNPHYGRPFDDPVTGGYVPQEHPLEGVERLLKMAQTIKQQFPDITVVGTGLTWLRQFMPHVAAAMIEQGWMSVAGLGRGAFAYPEFARDIIHGGGMDPLKVCITCSSCTQIMRDDGRTGCVPRDPKVYEDIYKQGRWKDPQIVRQWASHCRQCIEPTCAAHCPSGIDIPSFLKEVAEGKDQNAYRILRRSNLLPEICGYVCPVEVQCQGHCIEQYVGDAAIPIARIQAWVAERARDHGWTALDIPEKISGKRIAVIGAGPAGLSCTATLLEHGHQVVIFDRSMRPGGKAVSVIPGQRLSSKYADGEISSIFEPINTDRLEWRLGTPLSADYTLSDIGLEGFNAIALTFGLGNTGTLAKKTPKPEGVMDALAFLEQMNRNPMHHVEGNVAIIGGGNTAADAAVMAKERGATDVFLIYRRSFDEMPAWPKERDNLIKSGIHVMILTQPTGYETDATNRLKAVNVVRTQLGQPDQSERRKPEPIEGTEHTLPIDYAIEALGEQIVPEIAEVLYPLKLTSKGTIEVDPKTFMTSMKGIFAAGDLVNGGTTVVQAIAEGRKTAKAIDEYLETSQKPVVQPVS